MPVCLKNQYSIELLGSVGPRWPFYKQLVAADNPLTFARAAQPAAIQASIHAQARAVAPDLVALQAQAANLAVQLGQPS